MGKYSDAETGVFSIFSSQDWMDTEIATFPSNFGGDAPLDEYIRVSIVSGGEGVNIASSSGIIMIDIFTPYGTGPARASEIADTLDAYLVGKTLDAGTGTVQLIGSTFSGNGADRANQALFKSLYTIPFSYFGVL